MSADLDTLRDLIDRAGQQVLALAGAPGEVPPVESRPSFLVAEPGNDPAEVIDKLATAERPITFVVGAGASMEAGLPSWAALVRGMLEDVAPAIEAPARQAWMEAISDGGLLAAAAVARALCGDHDRFRTILRDRLYRGRSPLSYEPGPLLDEVAAFKAAFPEQVELVTFNYDDLLERALRTLDVRSEGRVDDVSKPGVAVVRHLHGRVDAHRSDHIVLSEDDYARFPDHAGWQDRVMGRAFDGLCVFVGLSLTDQNLLRWMYQQEGADRHLALLTRQSATQLGNQVRREIEAATRARLAIAGVDAYWTDFYAELAQVIHEARRRRGVGRRPAPFAERAARRAERGRQRCMPRTRVEARQRRLQELLLALGQMVRQVAGAQDVDLSAEAIGLGLWGLDHERREISLWASSDRIHLDPSTQSPVPLALTSRWVAVEAVTNGSPVQTDPAVYASRWRLVHGIPLVWGGASGRDRIPVGAATLTSDVPAGESQLQRLPPAVMRQIERSIHDLLVRLWN